MDLFGKTVPFASNALKRNGLISQKGSDEDGSESMELRISLLCGMSSPITVSVNLTMPSLWLFQFKLLEDPIFCFWS